MRTIIHLIAGNELCNLYLPFCISWIIIIRISDWILHKVLPFCFRLISCCVDRSHYQHFVCKLFHVLFWIQRVTFSLNFRFLRFSSPEIISLDLFLSLFSLTQCFCKLTVLFYWPYTYVLNAVTYLGAIGPWPLLAKVFVFTKIKIWKT